ncbi:tetratricopeptide repeat protein [Mucilaginibacter limnophilus]|uniref:histidine kinase n=1 Tax=Mucilaginibacter limnophilus TaxID=1932778 RepID=A0A3S2Y2L2_9SPHI|nr:tetratricopeptide repeat protein [Mucilaginibacter limnophilus]RVU00469.1 tetratricopeptide repeat protein [Mucilaginibacter limnophilus]
MLKSIPAKILLAILLPLMCFADIKTDSLLNRLKKITPRKGSDTARVNLINQIADAYRYTNADSSVAFAKKAIQLAGKSKYFKGEANGLYMLGSTYYVMGNYFASLEAASQLATISDRAGYKLGIANAYHLRGLVFLSQDEFDDAIVDFEKSLKEALQLNNKRKLTMLYFNIGICYDEMKKPEKAFEYLNKGMQVSKEIGDEHMVSMTNNRLGEVFFKIGQYKEAILFHQKVLKAEYQDNWENAFAYSGLAQAQYALKQYEQAIINAQKSVVLARKTSSLWDEVRALKILAKAHAAKGNYKAAYDSNVLMNKLDDSLNNESRQQKINYLQLKQQRSDNLRLVKDNEVHEQKSKFNRLLIGGIGLLAACISIFAVVITRSNMNKTSLNKKLERRNKAIALQKDEIYHQNERLDQLNQTKNQLFSVISHDLRGPFASMIQTIEFIRSGDVEDDEKELILERFYQQVGHIAGMVNNLLLWANSQLTGIKSEATKIDVKTLVQETIAVSEFLATDKNINLIHDNDAVTPAFADPDHVRIIVQNIIGNAIKFTPKGGTITIDYPSNEKYCVIRIKDTGVGITPEKMHKLFKIVGKGISGYGTNNEVGAGIGLLLIKQFVDVNKGEIKIHSEPGAGTEVLVCLPKFEVNKQPESNNFAHSA